jgi:hypothetical protein
MSDTYTFSFVGAASTTAQAYDFETCSIDELSSPNNKAYTLNMPYDALFQDFVLTAALTNNRQFAFWVGGRKVSSNLYGAQLNPANPSRFQIINLKLVVLKGSQFQVRTAQLAGAIEAGQITLLMAAVKV